MSEKKRVNPVWEDNNAVNQGIAFMDNLNIPKLDMTAQSMADFEISFQPQEFQKQPQQDNGLINYEKDEVTGFFDAIGDFASGVADVDRGNVPLVGGVLVGKQYYDILSSVNKKNNGEELTNDEENQLTDYLNTTNRRDNTSWAEGAGRGLNELLTLGADMAITSLTLGFGSTSLVARGTAGAAKTALKKKLTGEVSKKILKRKLKQSLTKTFGSSKIAKVVTNTFVKGTSVGANTLVGGSLKITGGEVFKNHQEKKLIKALNGDNQEIANAWYLDYVRSFSDENKELKQDYFNAYSSVAVEKGFGAMGVFNSKVLGKLKQKAFDKLIVVEGINRLLQGRIGQFLQGQTNEKVAKLLKTVGRHKVSEELFENRDETFMQDMFKSYDEKGFVNVTESFMKAWTQTDEQWKQEITLNLVAGALISSVNSATVNGNQSAVNNFIDREFPDNSQTLPLSDSPTLETSDSQNGNVARQFESEEQMINHANQKFSDLSNIQPSELTEAEYEELTWLNENIDNPQAIIETYSQIGFTEQSPVTSEQLPVTSEQLPVEESLDPQTIPLSDSPTLQSSDFQSPIATLEVGPNVFVERYDDGWFLNGQPMNQEMNEAFEQKAEEQGAFQAYDLEQEDNQIKQDINTHLENANVEPQNIQLHEPDEFSEVISEIFDKKVILFSTENEIPVNGMTGSFEDTLYVNDDNNKTIQFVTAHELTHQLEKDSPELYQELKDMINNNLNEDYKKYEQEQGKKQDDNNVSADIANEFVADYLAGEMESPKFWKDLGKQNPTLAMKVKDRIAEIVTTLKNLLKSNNITEETKNELDVYLGNLEQVQQTALDVTAKYIKTKNLQAEKSGNAEPQLGKKDIIEVKGNEIELTKNKSQNKKNAIEYGKKNVRGVYKNIDTGFDININANTFKEIVWKTKNNDDLKIIPKLGELIETAKKTDENNPEIKDGDSAKKIKLLSETEKIYTYENQILIDNELNNVKMKVFKLKGKNDLFIYNLYHSKTKRFASEARPETGASQIADNRFESELGPQLKSRHPRGFRSNKDYTTKKGENNQNQNKSSYPIERVPVNALKIDPKRFQFKSNVTEQGVIKQEQLQADEYNELAGGNILVWEDKKGQQWVVNGHHRFDLAKRLDEDFINVQIIKETDGFSAKQAKAKGAEINIQEEKGSIEDYVTFFQSYNKTEREAKSAGLLSRQKGKQGFLIGKYASEDLITSFKNGDVSAEKAAVIADNARNDKGLQSLGIKQAKVKDVGLLNEFIRTAKLIGRNTEMQEQDLFNFDDSALAEADAIAVVASDTLKEIKQDKNILLEARKKKTALQLTTAQAKKYNITNRNDLKQINKAIADIDAELYRWEHWDTNAELYQELRDKAGLGAIDPKTKMNPDRKPKELMNLKQSVVTSNQLSVEENKEIDTTQNLPEGKNEKVTNLEKENLTAEKKEVSQAENKEDKTTNEVEEVSLFSLKDEKKNIKVFTSKLNDYNKGNLKTNEVLSLKNKSKVLAENGINDNIILKQKVLKKTKLKHSYIPFESLKELPKQINNPIAIFKSKNDSRIILTELKSKNNDNVVAIIEIDKSGPMKSIVSNIKSIHPRNQEQLDKLVDLELRTYVDEKRWDNMTEGFNYPSDKIPLENKQTKVSDISNKENPRKPTDLDKSSINSIQQSEQKNNNIEEKSDKKEVSDSPTPEVSDSKSVSFSLKGETLPTKTAEQVQQELQKVYHDFSLKNPEIAQKAKKIREVDYKLTKKGFIANVRAGLQPISTTLKKISPRLNEMLRNHVLGIERANQADMKNIKPLMDFSMTLKKINLQDWNEFDMARKNADNAKIQELFEKYKNNTEFKKKYEKKYKVKFSEDIYNQFRKTLDDIHQRAEKAGYEVGYLEDYHPRMVKDLEGLQTYLQGKLPDGMIDKAWANQAEIKGSALTYYEKVNIVNSLVRGNRRLISLAATSNMKERKIDVVDAEIDKFYYDSDEALTMYVGSINKQIQNRLFFGKHQIQLDTEKIPDGSLVLEENLKYQKIAEIRKEVAKKIKNDLQGKQISNKAIDKNIVIVPGTFKIADINKMSKIESYATMNLDKILADAKLVVEGDGKYSFTQSVAVGGKAQTLKHTLITAKDGTLMYQGYKAVKPADFANSPSGKILDFMNEDKSTVIENSVGDLITQLVESRQIKGEHQEQAIEVLNAYFNYKGTPAGWSQFKMIGYLTTMGSAVANSAITQLQDVSMAVHYAGWRNTAVALTNAILGKSKVTEDFVPYDNLNEEYRSIQRLHKTVEKVFKYTGLALADKLGKETLINAVNAKYQQKAKKNPAKLASELRKTYGAETNQLIADLAEGKETDNVQMLLWNDLLEVQPIALTEMPTAYLNNPKGRTFYMLKTFTVKQIDTLRRESITKFNEAKTPAEKAKVALKFTQLVTVLVASGMTADAAKNLLFNREYEPEDSIISNLLQLMMISKFDYWTAKREGLEWAFLKKILPPVPFIERPGKDIIDAFEGKLDPIKARTLGILPFVGKFHDYYVGKRSEKKKKMW